MVVMSDREQLDVQDIPPEIHQPRQLAAPHQLSARQYLSPKFRAPNKLGSSIGAGPEGLSLNELEKQVIAETLTKTKGNRQIAAKILGIGERTLYRKIKEYNL
jgi:two-component system response regulator HydG